MSNAASADVPSSNRVEQAGFLALLGVAGAIQFSIAVGQILLAIAIACWLATIITRRESVAVPRFIWPLAAYAALTLLSAVFSPQPRTSLVDSKQLVLLLVVPVAYRFLTGARAQTLASVVVSFGAVSAAYGIVQYAILHYDHLGQRPQGTLGHYMTYSGLLMLVIGTALSRILFGKRERLWAGLVMPALLVAVVLSFGRSAVFGACAAAALLLSLKDFRLLAIVPVFAAIFFMTATPALTARFMSFSLKDPTTRDRVAMVREGEHMIRAHPMLGVGPNMVEPLYAEYRDADAVNEVNPHLHNVPLQIAAERGLPALAAWLWFVVVVLVDLARSFKSGHHRVLTCVALAAVTSMLAAGLFEYNFGDSEFLILFLALITLPFAAARTPDTELTG